MSKAYGIGGYKAALASCRLRGVFDTDSASLSIEERISKKFLDNVVHKQEIESRPVTRA